jgi:hypothetical protein
MKRQRGRNRGGGGGGGGGKPQQNANRAFDSNGPDGVKVRGNAQHVFEKYQQLARDAGSAGDRVLAENYLQHAEHYFRLLRAMQPQRPASEILGRDQFASGFDIDFEDESGLPQTGEGDAPEAEPAESADGGGDRNGGWQGDRNRDDNRPRDDRPRNDRYEGRGRDRWRDRDDRPRDDNRPRDENRSRDDRPRDDRPRSERYDRNEPRPDRGEQRDPLAVVEPQHAPLPVAEDRPSPVLRDADGGESHAPAFLQARPAESRPEAATGEEKPARRPRRRAPRSFEGGDTPSATEPEEA